ncbi:hypothetical protein K0M31_007187 [Melipona bicolor]|uniref:Uncharacterized protein n=1 Tax=Melipona bicolor TaxID=60889 RepID=A0AA40FRT9_9HYME|nr:hypothetical protein K0M31_007187 [Melipona bicolor]
MRLATTMKNSRRLRIRSGRGVGEQGGAPGAEGAREQKEDRSRGGGRGKGKFGQDQRDSKEKRVSAASH